MNKHLLLFFVCLLSIGLNAQDLIIRTTHDTIHCSIQSIGSKTIFYTVKQADGSIIGNTLPLSQVENYVYVGKPKAGKKVESSLNDPFIVGLNVGYSTMPYYLDFFQTPLPTYYNTLKSGVNVSLNAYHMIRTHMGLGAEFSMMKTYASTAVQGGSSSTLFLVGSEKTWQYVSFIGPSVLFKHYLDAGQTFILSEYLSAGLMYARMEYRSTYPEVSDFGYIDIASNMLMEGYALGGKLGISAAYTITPSVSIGLGCHYMMGSLKKASLESYDSHYGYESYDNQTLLKAMNVSHLDYSFVMQFYF